MEKECYAKIIQVNLKNNYIISFLTTMAVCCLTALLFNIKALTAAAAVTPIELLLCFTGIMMLTPVFLPEQNPAIKDVIRSKQADYMMVCFIRLIYSVVTVVLVNFIFIQIMKMQESQVGMYHILVAVSGALFLGAIGFFVSGVTENTTLGYMISMGYYLINYSVKEKFGIFNMFSGAKGTYEDKMWLLLWAVLLIALTFIYIKIKSKR